MLSLACRHLLSWVFPSPCVTCGRLLGANEKALCADCKGSLALIPPPHHACCGRHQQPGEASCPHCADSGYAAGRVMAAMLYEKSARKLLCALKFERRKDAAPLLTQKSLEYFDAMPEKPRWDAVLAVPMPRLKIAERGFNQSEIFAKAVAKHLALPFLNKALGMTHAVTTQSTLDKDHRRKNVQGAFRAASTRVSSKRLLLVDDILTTGSTSSECARSLLKAGANSVDIFCVARGL